MVPESHVKIASSDAYLSIIAHSFVGLTRIFDGSRFDFCPLRNWSGGERCFIFATQRRDEILVFRQGFELGHSGQSLQTH